LLQIVERVAITVTNLFINTAMISKHRLGTLLHLEPSIPPGFSSSWPPHWKTIPPRRLCVDSDRSDLQETAEDGVLDTFRSACLVAASASTRLLRRGFSLPREAPLEARRGLDLNATRRSRLGVCGVVARERSWLSWSSRARRRSLVCALSYLSLILMFLKLSEMVEWERDGS